MAASTRKLEVGDILLHETWMGKRTYKVHRVTKTMAFVWFNDICEGKFKRDLGFNGMHVQEVPRNTTMSKSNWTLISPPKEPTQ